MSSTTERPLITRDVFILPSHVQTALRGPNYPHAPATMTVVTEDGQVHDVPVPAEFVQRGVLPPGYTVDFLLDPEELVAKFTGSGLVYLDELPEEMIDKMREIINGVGNLKIVPQWLCDRKRELVSGVIPQHDDATNVEAWTEASASSTNQVNIPESEGKKEKKKGFLKGLFGKK